VSGCPPLEGCNHIGREISDLDGWHTRMLAQANWARSQNRQSPAQGGSVTALASVVIQLALASSVAALVDAARA